MSAQILSRRRLDALSRRYALPFTYGWARGERWYRLHTANHTIYYLTFTGTRPGRRNYVLRGPSGLCAAESRQSGTCVLNALTLVPNPTWPGELVGVLP
jgi:hypothetical protein